METCDLLMVSDIHMSNKLPHARPVPGGSTDRLNDQVALWNRIHAQARARNVAAIMVLGDLFDKSLVDAVTLTVTVEAVADSPKPVVILPGNHDAVSTSGERFTVEAFGKMGNDRVTYLKTGERYTPPGVDPAWLGFWPLEYCSTEKARAWICKMKMDAPERVEGTTEVLLLHQSILGCTHVGWTCDDGLLPEEACAGFNWTFSGHFHDPQNFGPDKRGLYLGAPMHHRFDDAGRPAGFWFVRFRADGSAKRVFIDGGCPRFHETKWPSKNPPEAKAAVGDYIRLEVSATAAEWEARKNDVFAEVARLVAAGFRASYKHKPIYHHAVRIKLDKSSGDSTDDAAKMSPEQAVAEYVDSPDVETGGLDRKKLLAIGREAIAAARLKAGGEKDAA